MSPSLTRRQALAGTAAGAAAAACGVAGSARANASAEMPVVVELFTSQGCHSCPPADHLLGVLAKQPDVIALGFHVDYWDRLGWKDEFARPEFTQRQVAYMQSLNAGRPFTPNKIVDGRVALIGSRLGDVFRAVDEARTRARMRVAVEVAGGDLRVTLPERNLEGPADVALVGTLGEKTSSIGAGENAGKTLTYYNSVVSLQRLAVWDGAAATMRVPAAILDRAELWSVLVQAQNAGPILGAAKVPTAATG